MAKSDFDIGDFLPYALNRAAEASSRGFQRYYKAKYGMTRTEWRVLFHLGRHGAMTASAICRKSDIHKTKVSRAVAALDKRRLLVRRPVEADRRHETLTLTNAGQTVYRDLAQAAQRFDADLADLFAPEEQAVLRRCLARIAAQGDGASG